MQKLNVSIVGVFFAFSAAALNASIGVISKFLMEMGISASSIAFLKTLIGYVILTLIFVIVRKSKTRIVWWQAAICAFLGIFILFFFETAAYKHDLAANVVVTLMAFASVSALLFSWPILGDKPNVAQWLGFFLTIAGVSVIVGIKSIVSIQGVLLAAIAGTGYGLFSVLMKKFKIEGGIVLTRLLLFYGATFLLFPAYIDGFEPELLQQDAMIALVTLAILPTILGFYCTTKAIQLLPPARVQILELSEPLFAALLALLFLHEVPGLETYLGGILIIVGLAVSNEVIKKISFFPKSI